MRTPLLGLHLAGSISLSIVGRSELPEVDQLYTLAGAVKRANRHPNQANDRGLIKQHQHLHPVDIPMPTLIAILLLFSTAVFHAQAATSVPLQIGDAKRFSSVFSDHDGAPDAEALQRNYLANGTQALASFSPEYIGDASALAKAVALDPARYRHAIATCLPALSDAQVLLDELASAFEAVFPQAPVPTVAVVFGAGHSAGTMIDGRVLIGIERACDGAADGDDFLRRLKPLIAHEWIHTLQPALTDDDRRDLLVWALREGMANVLAAHVIRAEDAGVDPPWALPRESALWAQFQADRATLLAHWPSGGHPDAIGEAAGTRWFWNTAAEDGRPADLGYWIGQRIVTSWYSRQPDASVAARELVATRNYERIVREGGYSPKTGSVDLP